MKKYCLLLVLPVMLLLTACPAPGPDDPDEEKNARFESVAAQYVDHTVIVTYKNLADYAEVLVQDLKKVKEEPTDANVQKACEDFLQARAWWEKSEAFLFGPASDFGIDPHIDSWPLDKDGLEDEMKNEAHIAAMEGEDGDIWAGNKLGPELLGFHGIEYIIFANGQPKAAADIPANQLTYAIAVAGDLRNNCYRLELSWAGEENVSEERLAKIEEMEVPYTVSGSGYSYKENMMNAGRPGSIYPSWTGAMQAIVDGAATIADEVGTMKIGKPFSGEDVNYIESPYSHKSIQDFYDNMVSVENAYMGGVEGERNDEISLHAYIRDVNKDLDKRCTEAIADAKAKIAGMKAPFVLNYTDAATVQPAINACRALEEVLMEVKKELAR